MDFGKPEGTEFVSVSSPDNLKDNPIALVGNGISAIGWGEKQEDAEQLAIYLHEFYRLGGNANSSAEETKRIDKLVIKNLKKRKNKN